MKRLPEPSETVNCNALAKKTLKIHGPQSFEEQVATSYTGFEK
jgi:hypothetical protein